MLFEFYDGGKLIGRSRLTAADPPMGVASGSFEPTEIYRPDLHANTIDGEYVGDRTLTLRVTGPDLNSNDAEVLAIEDFQSTLQERHVHITVEASHYERLFSHDPAYRSYYRLDLSEEERLAQDRALEARFRARHIRDWLWFLGIIAGLVFLLIWMF